MSANLKRGAFYVCPGCANVVWSSGEAAVGCCGNAPEPLRARDNDGALEATVEMADGCQRVRVAHHMVKNDHLLFVAAVGDDVVRIKRLYSEQEAYAEFLMQGPCKLYAYDNECGLIEL